MAWQVAAASGAATRRARRRPRLVPQPQGLCKRVCKYVHFMRNDRCSAVPDALRRVVAMAVPVKLLGGAGRPAGRRRAAPILRPGCLRQLRLQSSRHARGSNKTKSCNDDPRLQACVRARARQECKAALSLMVEGGPGPAGMQGQPPATRGLPLCPSQGREGWAPPGSGERQAVLAGALHAKRWWRAGAARHRESSCSSARRQQNAPSGRQPARPRAGEGVADSETKGQAAGSELSVSQS